jgi:hypothetical protein
VILQKSPIPQVGFDSGVADMASSLNSQVAANGFASQDDGPCTLLCTNLFPWALFLLKNNFAHA